MKPCYDSGAAIQTKEAWA